MKYYMIGAGIIMLFVFAFVCFTDINLILTEDAQLDTVAMDAANAAAIALDKEEYAEGNLVFDDSQANELAYNVLDGTFDFTDSMKSDFDGHLEETFTYIIDYFDDSLSHRSYTNGNKTKEEAFAYGDYFAALNGKTYTILKPCVFVSVDAGKLDFSSKTAKRYFGNLITTQLYVQETWP